MPFAAASPAVVELARYRAARRPAEASKALVTPSPIGFAFLNLPVRDCLPAFMAAGFASEARVRDV